MNNEHQSFHGNEIETSIQTEFHLTEYRKNKNLEVKKKRDKKEEKEEE